MKLQIIIPVLFYWLFGCLTNQLNAQCTTVEINQPQPGLYNGSITLSLFCGVLPYSFQWSDGSSILPSNGNFITGLSEGTYYVTIEDGFCGQMVDEFTLENICYELEMSAPTLSPIVMPSSCTSSDGSIVPRHIFVAGGGQHPYTYHWENNQGQIITSLSNLSTGIYWLVGTDVYGCTGRYMVDLRSAGDISFIHDVVGSCSNLNQGEIGISLINNSSGQVYANFAWSTGAIETNVS